MSSQKDQEDSSAAITSNSGFNRTSDFYDLTLLADQQKMLLNNMLSPPVDFLYPQPSLIGATSLVPSAFDNNTPSRETQQYLAQVLAKSNKRHRGEKKPIPDMMKDTKYFERRKRNNMAAKKSRDARKIREDQVSQRADELEKENAQLRIQVANLREISTSLRAIIINKAACSVNQ